jgi:hypothetical protein
VLATGDVVKKVAVALDAKRATVSRRSMVSKASVMKRRSEGGGRVRRV